MSQKKNNNDDEEDETFYYHYDSTTSIVSAPPSSSYAVKPSRGRGGSGGLAPSKSTVYSPKATVLKDLATRQSRRVAFIIFVSCEDAIKAVKGIDKKVLNGRTLRTSISTDNGRASEFIRKNVYKDKSRCYECGEEGHLSYECPRNFLGARERSVVKKMWDPGGGTGGKNYDLDDEVEEL
ncbi:U11/U12 small nuclear ribonucleoprotein 31 kDa protein [Forsythia ovata]|uniref:U11/U12 small nuclear ribonucleoprotein 31 kDa protein n=1 Tax=Forsythia ovata TaxID=205694 RepID=A0ABD1W6M2_9LAMI